MPEPSWVFEKWMDGLDPMQVEQILLDDPYFGLSPAEAAQLARQRFDRYYVRRPGVPAVPHSLGPGYGIQRMRVTHRRDDGELVL